eukprot:1161654-Pelagomonas_calceolata.AAC.17
MASAHGMSNSFMALTHSSSAKQRFRHKAEGHRERNLHLEANQGRPTKSLRWNSETTVPLHS